MERQKLRYPMGYCLTMLLIAVVWSRTGQLRVQQTITVEREESMSEEALLSGYQAMYPDMYVEQVKETTSDNAIKEERWFYLTFDDGPSVVTEDILEILEEMDVKASFFLVGNRITEEKEELVRQMAEAGHVIGIHTYSHDQKEIYTSVEGFLTDFHKTYERIKEVTGVAPKYFRFPWGSINCYNKEIRRELIREMERRGFQYFDWNVSGEDSVGNPNEQTVLQNVTDTFPRFLTAVVLLHDSAINRVSAKVLPQILTEAQNAGYEFGTIDQLEEAYQWSNSY